MSFFDQVEGAPDDPILSLNVAYREDPSELKINLGIGAYKDSDGKSWVLPSVREAEKRILEKELPKDYLQIDGLPPFKEEMSKLIFGEGCEAVKEGRVATAQSVGGSGALRTGGDFIRRYVSERIVISDPAWANHEPCFQAARLTVEKYPYYDRSTHALDFDAMRTYLEKLPEGTAILLQACCHNPTGLDPSWEQWKEISEIVKKRRLFPLFDLAYQGFKEGLEEDVSVIGYFLEQGHQFILAASCSKNFGLYGERVGFLAAVCDNEDEAARVLSQFKKLVRSNYSNPPLQGARIVAEILGHSELRQQWVSEVTTMRERIQAMRSELIAELAKREGVGDFSFMSHQGGMFSFCDLKPEQVDRLQQEHSVYMVRCGRINIAGLNSTGIQHLANAIEVVSRSHETNPL